MVKLQFPFATSPDDTHTVIIIIIIIIIINGKFVSLLALFLVLVIFMLLSLL